jgi:hypothetical protein
MTIAFITVECPKCKRRRDIGPREIPEGNFPMCDTCLFPMFAVGARSS